MLALASVEAYVDVDPIDACAHRRPALAPRPAARRAAACPSANARERARAPGRSGLSTAACIPQCARTHRDVVAISCVAPGRTPAGQSSVCGSESRYRDGLVTSARNLKAFCTLAVLIVHVGPASFSLITAS